MGKSIHGHRKVAKFNKCQEVTSCVALSEVYISDSTWRKLMARDSQQIEDYRQAYEGGKDMIRVVLRPRFDGGFNVEDGRHRVIAAKLAGMGEIEALIIGDDCQDD